MAIGIAVLIAAGAAGSGWYFQQRARARAHAATQQNPVAPPVPSEISLAGKVEARKIVAVPAPLDGTIERYLVDVGDAVFEGEVLAHIKNARLDAAEESVQTDAERAQARIAALESQLIAARLEQSRAEADAARGKAEFDRADKAYRRQQILINAGATPRLVFEKAEKDYEIAKAQYEGQSELARKAAGRVDTLVKDLENAKSIAESKTRDLEDAKAQVAAGEVRSPASGVVVARRGQAGDPGDQSVTGLLQIAVDLTSLQVVADADPRDAPRIHQGQAALIQIAEAPEGIQGTVREVKTGRVFVDFTSPTPAIKPGLTAQVKIRLS